MIPKDSNIANRRNCICAKIRVPFTRAALEACDMLLGAETRSIRLCVTAWGIEKPAASHFPTIIAVPTTDRPPNVDPT